jgi:hypothetical protein
VKKSEISLLSASPEKNTYRSNFSAEFGLRARSHAKRSETFIPAMQPKIYPNNPHETLNPLIFPQIDRNSEHYCVAQARSTHHQHQLCCKFVTCYMLFLFLRDSFTEVLSKSF